MTKKSNVKQTSNATANDVNEKIYCVADVARELKIDAKRARAFLRKHATLYTMRKQRFTKNSTLYKQCIDALTQFKNKTIIA